MAAAGERSWLPARRNAGVRRSATSLATGDVRSSAQLPRILQLSTAFGDLRNQRIRVPRGLAIKVLGVTGPKALHDDRSANQDFLLVNHKSHFSDANAYVNVVRLVALRTRRYRADSLPLSTKPSLPTTPHKQHQIKWSDSNRNRRQVVLNPQEQSPVHLKGRRDRRLQSSHVALRARRRRQ
jgi:hypothetical protein